MKFDKIAISRYYDWFYDNHLEGGHMKRLIAWITHASDYNPRNIETGRVMRIMRVMPDDYWVLTLIVVRRFISYGFHWILSWFDYLYHQDVFILLKRYILCAINSPGKIIMIHCCKSYIFIVMRITLILLVWSQIVIYWNLLE